MNNSDKLFLISILIILLVSAYFHHKPKVRLIENPIYHKLDNFASNYNLDISSFKELKPGWKFQPNELDIFDLPANSADVLLVGDSSVNYGVEPTVVEQVSGLNVAVFAYPALSINSSLLEYVGLLANKVLKKGGRVIFMFDPGFWISGHQSQQNHQLEELISQRYQTDCLFCMESLRTHEKMRSKTSWMIFINQWFGLNSVEFYSTVIEPKLAPQQTLKKFKNNQGITKNEQRFFLSDGHVLIVKERPNIAQKNLKKDFPKYVLDRQQNLAEIISNLKHPKVMVLPITQTAEIHQKLQQLSYVLSPQMIVIDLNESIPGNWKVPTQNRTHMANEGIIQQSYLLGQELAALFGTSVVN